MQDITEKREVQERERRELEEQLTQERMKLYALIGEVQEIREQYNQVTMEADKKRNERDSYKWQCEHLQEQMAALTREVDNLRQNQTETAAAIQKNNAEAKRLRNKRTQLQKAFQTGKEEVEALRAETEDLEKRLAEKNYTEQKNRLLVAQKLNLAIDKEFAVLEEETKKLNQRLELTRQSCRDREADQIRIRDRIKKENNDTAVRIRWLQEQTEQLRTQRRQLSETEVQLKLQVQKETDWLQGMEAQTYRRQAERLGKRLAELERVRKNLLQDLESLWGKSLGEKANESRKICVELEEELQTIRKRIKGCRDALLQAGEILTSSEKEEQNEMPAQEEERDPS